MRRFTARGRRAESLESIPHERLACPPRKRVSERAPLAAALTALSMPVHAADCDATRGSQAFQSKCATCHSIEAGHHLTGPSLYGLGGQTAGTAKGFNFSAAVAESAIVWTAASLDAFLASPQTFIPGTVMPFGGIKNASERAALGCYLFASQ